MDLSRPIASLVLLLACLAAAPATRPTPDQSGRRLAGRALALDDLTDVQRRQIEAITANVRDDVEAARTTTGPAARGSTRSIVERGRIRVLAVLTPVQRDRLRAERNGDEEATTSPTTAPTPAALDAATRRVTSGVGDRLPSFALAQVNGKPITLESLVGKPFVLVFGSYSSPTFRDQLPRIADLATRYGSRVSFVAVYTREMFPATQSAAQPERNQDAGVAVAAAATDADRRSAAKQLTDVLKLKLPVGVDAIDDRLADEIRGSPSATIVADAKGLIVARWDWPDPFAIKRALDRLLAAK